MVDWAPHLNHLQRAQRQGLKVPALENKPELAAYLSPVLSAFLVLDRSRSSNGYGPNAIPLVEIIAYLDFLGMQVYEERDEWLQLIQLLDQAVLKDSHARITASTKRTTGNDRSKAVRPSR